MDKFNDDDLVYTPSVWGEFSQDEGLIVEFCDFTNGIVNCHIHTESICA